IQCSGERNNARFCPRESLRHALRRLRRIVGGATDDFETGIDAGERLLDTLEGLGSLLTGSYGDDELARLSHAAPPLSSSLPPPRSAPARSPPSPRRRAQAGRRC